MLHGSQIGLGEDGGEFRIGYGSTVSSTSGDADGIKDAPLGGKETVSGKAPVQKLLRLGVADIPGLCPHDDTDEGHAIALGGDRTTPINQAVFIYF